MSWAAAVLTSARRSGQPEHVARAEGEFVERRRPRNVVAAGDLRDVVLVADEHANLETIRRGVRDQVSDTLKRANMRIVRPRSFASVPGERTPRRSALAGAPERSLSALASPSILYSSYGPGDTYGVSALPIGDGFGQANYFEPAETVVLDTIEVTLALPFDGVAAPITFRLQADSAGLPGAVIESFAVTPAFPFDSSFRPPQTLQSSSHPQLTANARYWVTASMASGRGFWFNGPTGVGHTVDIVSHDDGATWGPSGFGQRVGPVMRITGSEPEGGIAGAVGDVEDLRAAGVLTEDQAQGLIDKLNAAVASLGAGRITPGCGQLDAFLNQVHAFVKAGILTTVQGQALTTEADEAATASGCV